MNKRQKAFHVRVHQLKVGTKFSRKEREWKKTKI